jgi:hypothetical protein
MSARVSFQVDRKVSQQYEHHKPNSLEVKVSTALLMEKVAEYKTLTELFQPAHSREMYLSKNWSTKCFGKGRLNFSSKGKLRQKHID